MKEQDTGKLTTQRNTPQSAIERVILRGDLNNLTEIERLQFNFAMCRSLGLNPLTYPIDYISHKGKMTPYVNAIGVAQLREIHGISVKIVRSQKDDEFIYTTAEAKNRDGRSEESTAIVPIVDNYGKKLKGQDKANAIMKCETKAKRRATLALCGIPWADSGNIKKSEYADPIDLIYQEKDLEF